METERRKVRVVELPVGATEDRVVGSLDLERALKSGEKRVEPGLLAAAHRGILYVDEVNLLDDHVVDILLDSAAMVVNTLEREGVKLFRTSVGDRYVAERLRRERLNFGGEKSGHLIFLDHATTGDGTLAALQILAVMGTTGKSLRDLASLIHLFPQTLISVPSARPAEAAKSPEVARVVKSVEDRLGGLGRVVLRPSGTEPVVRVMVEGEDEDLIHALARECAETVASAAIS